MRRFSAVLIIASIALVAVTPVADAGTIRVEISNLDGTPIGDQLRRTFRAVITTAQGHNFIVLRSADGSITSSAPGIAQLTLDTSAPGKPVFEITIANAIFTDPSNVAVTASFSLSGRTSPGRIRNIIGTSDTMLTLAFPINDACVTPCCSGRCLVRMKPQIRMPGQLRSYR